MWTHTGLHMYPLDPRENEICIEDIAQGLSMSCRFGGQCSKFYSIAQHSVYLSKLCYPKWALAGLLHDAAEAYVTDIPSPAKHFMPEYQNIEDNISKVIFAKFEIPWPLPYQVHRLDKAIVTNEARNLFKKQPSWAKYRVGLDIPDAYFDHTWSPEEAYTHFMSTFNMLMEQRDG